MKYQRIKGTKDFLPDETAKIEYLKQTARVFFRRYGYREIRTPVLEPTELFVHSTGVTSEVVEKQMYTFEDLGKRSVTLRPEGTPGVIRAIIENRLVLPQKLFYVETMFRQERPQKGRYREFNQIGLEVVGAGSPVVDAEVIAVAAGYVAAVGVTRASVEVNSIGCRECRPRFREALLGFVKPELARFCPECQARAERNPLRVYDCKNEQCQRLLERAPRPVDHLCGACLGHYDRVKRHLDLYKTAFVENPKLVRGLDYYTRTVFEIRGEALGAQDTVLGGGRYDYLMQEMGGVDAPAIGFALGLERLVLCVDEANLVTSPPMSFYIVALGEAALEHAVPLQQHLAGKGRIAIVGEPERPLKRQLKEADRLGVDYAVIIGEDEVKGNRYTVRDMKRGTQQQVQSGDLDRFTDECAAVRTTDISKAHDRAP